MSQDPIDNLLNSVSGEEVYDAFQQISDDLKQLAKLRARFQDVLDGLSGDSDFKEEMERIADMAAVKSAEYLKQRLLTEILERRNQ